MTAQLVIGNDSTRTKFPTKVVVNGDTAIAFSNEQVQKINQVKVDLDYCIRTKDSAFLPYIEGKNAEILSLKKTIELQDSSAALSRLSIMFLQDASAEKDRMYNDLKTSTDSQIKFLNRKIKKTVLKSGLIGGLGGAALGTIIGIILPRFIK